MHRPGGLVLHFHLLVFNSVQNKCQTRIYVKQPKELHHKVREKKIRNFPFEKSVQKRMSGSIRILKRNGLKGWTWTQVVGWLKIPSMGSFCGSLCESSPQGSNRFLFQDLQRGERQAVLHIISSALLDFRVFSLCVYIAICPKSDREMSNIKKHCVLWGWYNLQSFILIGS